MIILYKYELHLHTSGCSKCGLSTVEEMVTAAKDKGFTGIVVTDHFYRGNTCIDRDLPWEDFVSAYEQNWLKGKKLGESIGIDVIFGIEEVYNRDMKEVLIYGITPDELKAETDFRHYSLEQIFKFVDSHGGFVSHAHPFRDRSYIKNADQEPNPKALHGVEVFNVSDPDERNDMAVIYAKKYNLKPLSGGDVHKSDSRLGTSGIAVEERIKDTKQLARVLRSGDYKPVINGEIK